MPIFCFTPFEYMMKEILTEGKEGRKKIDMKIKLFLKLSSRENCVVKKERVVKIK